MRVHWAIVTLSIMKNRGQDLRDGAAPSLGWGRRRDGRRFSDSVSGSPGFVVVIFLGLVGGVLNNLLIHLLNIDMLMESHLANMTTGLYSFDELDRRLIEDLE